MFSPHTFIALNIEPNEKFSQAFHGAGHKCISRECFNWMRISKHLHTSISIYRQIYQGGPGASLIYIHTVRTTDTGHARIRRQHLDLGSRNLFFATQIFAFPVITHFISGPKILQKRKEEKLARSIKGLGLLYPISNPAFHPYVIE